ncbi:MAG: PIG-L family deacetylase [Spirochaetales bacterium]|nr:PIG-L family deacetylase [Spirochaetales bacterium]
MTTYRLSRRLTTGEIRRGSFHDVLPEYRAGERWLFLSPHDDDLAIAGGLAIAVAGAEGVEMRARIVTDGAMGYTSAVGADRIRDVRREETAACFAILGVDDYDWYDYPDAGLAPWQGRRRASDVSEAPHKVAGYTGLQNSFVAELRAWRPERLILLSPQDYHPDHKMVHQEALISLFHARGDIWPELGAPLEADPIVHEIAAYSPFAAAPDLELRCHEDVLHRKLDAIAAYASQRQIARLVESVRSAGPVEYLRTMPFEFYNAAAYAGYFRRGPSGDGDIDV